MKPIQPPTDEEKKAYWLNVKIKTLFAASILAITVVITILVYIFINHYDTIVFYGVPTLIVVLLSSVLSSIYGELYETWHKMYKRHRVGYYATYVNTIVMAIIFTILIPGLYYGLSYIGAGYNPHLMTIVSTIGTIALTTYFVSETKRIKPELPPISEQESDDREFLKHLYYGEQGIEPIEYQTGQYPYDILRYLGVLDYYLNYGVYDHKQVSQWKTKLDNSSLTIKNVFDEIDRANRTKLDPNYPNVYEKGLKKINDLTHSHELMRQPKLLRKRYQQYLD